MKIEQYKDIHSDFLMAFQNAINKALKKGDTANPLFRQKVYDHILKSYDNMFQNHFEKDKFDQIRSLLQNYISEIEDNFRAKHFRYLEKFKNTGSNSLPKEGLDITPMRLDSEKSVSDSARKKKSKKVKGVKSSSRGKKKLISPPQHTHKRVKKFRYMIVLVTIIFLGYCSLFYGKEFFVFFRSFLYKEEQSLSLVKIQHQRSLDVLKNDTPISKEERMYIFPSPLVNYVYQDSGAKADLLSGQEKKFLRFHSTTNNGNIIFDIKQAILEKCIGKNVLFNIVAKAEAEKIVEIAITCNFGDLGHCHRKRYSVNDEKNDYIFPFSFPNKKMSSYAGILAINPDFQGLGTFLDIHEIYITILP